MANVPTPEFQKLWSNRIEPEVGIRKHHITTSWHRCCHGNRTRGTHRHCPPSGKVRNGLESWRIKGGSCTSFWKESSRIAPCMEYAKKCYTTWRQFSKRARPKVKQSRLQLLRQPPNIADEVWSSQPELLRPTEVNRNGGWPWIRRGRHHGASPIAGAIQPGRYVASDCTNLSSKPEKIAKAAEGLTERQHWDP
jgi:hypothetical protein